MRLTCGEPPGLHTPEFPQIFPLFGVRQTELQEVELR